MSMTNSVWCVPIHRIGKKLKIVQVPITCALLYILSLPFILLYNDSRQQSKIVSEALKQRSQERGQNDARKTSFWLTRVLLLRSMGVCYLAAFLTSAFQARALFGSNGLQPLAYSNRPRPSPVFWFLVEICNTFLLPLCLWLLYLSIVNLGGWVMNYGWEWLTLEVGFLSIFLCPIFSFSPFPKGCPPPRLVLWLFRWCAFRLMIGAGMSKIGSRSSACWKELTCTTTHYFTQPMPNPLAWYAHHLPFEFHKIEVALTFFEQLILPFGILVPIRGIRLCTAVAELLFQAGIVSTGNYAWINFIGSVPCLALLDDHFLSFLFTCPIHAKLAHDGNGALARKGIYSWFAQLRSYCGLVIHVGLVIFIGYKSAAPLKELFSPSPWLHFYDDFFFVNAQGVFGFINQHRVNLALSYTHDKIPKSTLKKVGKACKDHPGMIGSDPSGRALRQTCNLCANYAAKDFEGMSWNPLEFKNLPGDPKKMPWFNSPYHHRLDWEVWIHTTGQKLTVPSFIQKLVRLFLIPSAIAIQKILAGDTDSISLVGTPWTDLLHVANSTPKRWTPPTAIKAQYFFYTYSSSSKNESWWIQTAIQNNDEIFWVSKVCPMSDVQSHLLFVRVSTAKCFLHVLNCVGGWTIFAQSLLLDYPSLRGEVCKLETFSILDSYFTNLLLFPSSHAGAQYQSILIGAIFLGIIASVDCFESTVSLNAIFKKCGNLVFSFMLIITAYDGYTISKSMQM
eukprot:680327-Hanusia_phi.AAC.2